MWKVQVKNAIKEIRFVMKPCVEHHGVWRFTETKLPELMTLNQNTFFSITPITAEYKTPSAVHFIYGDLDNTEDYVETSGLTVSAFEEVLKQKVSFGLTLNRFIPTVNSDKQLPKSIVEARNTIPHIDDCV